MQSIGPIRTEADYRQALTRVEAIFEATPGTPDFDELDILGTLVGAYEAKHFPIPAPVPGESGLALSEVWVFHGSGGRLASGIFTSQTQAEQFITQYRLTGVLTKYPVGISVYDWTIQERLFEPKKPEQFQAGFIQRFTTASQEHYHYDPDEIG
ncbi:type II toxin-antitoxin system HigA family antitoxin [Hymenobacter monticola]|uniref:DUF7710 domain-containing protein n=1 Tax=Hymenobacter monticola TaxID=1705399 RepID=A0ABY4B103_9BACT|nr:hypothetical protein [Hymenobacter monticola]UOE32655.1 hypothetical protein MTP16_16135 [Hymenobacter monticola]